MLKRVVNGKAIEIEDKDRTKVEVWSRVMGYHRPLDQWNIGKQQEHRDRTHFVEREWGGISTDCL